MFNEDIQYFIDRHKPIKRMPGYGCISFTPTDEEIFMNMVEYMSYWGSGFLFEYLEKDDYCKLIQKYYKIQDLVSNMYSDYDIKHYKNVYIIKKHNEFYQVINIFDDNEWFNEFKKWLKTDIDGSKLIREQKLKRIIDEEKELS